MRKTISFLLACVLLLSTALPVSAAHTENTVQPRFTHIVQVTSELQISNWGVATCTGSLKTSTAYPVKVVIRLQQLKNSSWTTLKEWTITDTGNASGTRYNAVYSGYYYRVYVNAYVYDNNGNILEFTYAEKQVYYG